VDTSEDRGDSELKEEYPDWNWEYWEAQLVGYQKALKKPVWRDFLQTQKEKMDALHDWFWEDVVEKKSQEQ
tara:strand:+ start:391 stop:603 length:213 start_codon:yes stop_codon:yes gene_type:complete